MENKYFHVGKGPDPVWSKVEIERKGCYFDFWHINLRKTEGYRVSELQLGTESLFSQAFKYSSIGMALVGLDGRWLKVNSALTAIVGYSEQELLNKTFQEMTHPDDLPLDFEFLVKLLAGKLNSYEMEKRYIHQFGHPVWVLLSGSLVHDDQGRPLYYIAQIQDISARKRAELLLKESEQRYKSLFEKHPDLVFSLSPDGDMLSVNSACERVTGYAASEILHFESIVIPEDQERVAGYFQQTIQGVPQDYEISIIHKKGHLIKLRITNIPIMIDHEIVGIYGIAKDITEFREKSKKLREREESYRYLVEHSPDAIMIGNNGKSLYVNDTAVKLLGGKNKEEIKSISPVEFIHPLCREEERDRFVKVEMGETRELKLIRLDGQEINVEMVSLPTIFEGQPAVHTIVRDISERKKTQELLQNSEKLSVTGQLAAGIAHEIRNPLTAIKGFFDLMKKDLEHRKDYLDIISSEMNRIELILSELLILAKPQVVKIAQCNLETILKQVISLLDSQAHLHSVQLQLRVEAEQTYLPCDENQLKQVFINFIKNAVEAMPVGGIVLIEVIRIYPGNLCVRISDQGSGMTEEELAKLGQPFFTTKQSGTGLGFMISSNIIKQHGGSILVSSKVNKGTRIEITLPIESLSIKSFS